MWGTPLTRNCTSIVAGELRSPASYYTLTTGNVRWSLLLKLAKASRPLAYRGSAMGPPGGLSAGCLSTCEIYPEGKVCTLMHDFYFK